MGGRKSESLVNGRCYMAPVVKKFAELKDSMNDRHWVLLRSTPFAYCLELDAVVQERSLLHELLKSWDEKTQTFSIGESPLKFRPEDVAMVLGLPCKGRAVLMESKELNRGKRKKEKTDFVENYLTKACDRSRDAISRNLSLLVKENGAEENFVRLLIAYLFATVFFCNTSMAAPVWTGYYVEDIVDIGGYAWACAVHEFLMNDINELARKVKNNNVRNGYMKGCSIALIVWLYELINAKKRKRHGMLPRILNYGDHPFSKANTAAALFSSLKGKMFQPLTAANREEEELLENVFTPTVKPLRVSKNTDPMPEVGNVEKNPSPKRPRHTPVRRVAREQPAASATEPPNTEATIYDFMHMIIDNMARMDKRVSALETEVHGRLMPFMTSAAQMPQLRTGIEEGSVSTSRTNTAERPAKEEKKESINTGRKRTVRRSFCRDN